MTRSAGNARGAASEAAAMRAAHACWTDSASGARARAHVVFAVEGLRCAACSRKLERAIGALPGAGEVTVNVATGRAAIAWDPERLSLGRILAAVKGAGFRAAPLAGDATADAQRDERRLAMKRMGLAGLGMMQTMMLLYGLYAPGTGGIDEHLTRYLRLTAMLLVTPIVLYSGAPFLRGAWRDLRERALGMDVPVALAVVLAFGASVVNALRGAGEIYFDSAAMFVFFLLTGRFLEMTVRHRSLSSAEALARSQPASAVRVRADATTERVSVQTLLPGDRIRIARGAVVPVDATLLADTAAIDESLVTGESAAMTRKAGDALPGGAVNCGDPIDVCARTGAQESTLASIVRLLERAQAERPRLALVADRIASWFVLTTLGLAAAVALVWAYLDPPRALPAALAVLVVTCPCALSLATPAAAAAATARLAQLGLLVCRADALERLARVDTIVLDKTGTLSGRVQTARVAVLGQDSGGGGRLGAIAAALERSSEHPLAAAFAPLADPAVWASEVREVAGCGLEGKVEGVLWRLGRLDFVSALAGEASTAKRQGGAGSADLYLGSAQGICAEFVVADTLRPEATQTVGALRRLGLQVIVASGDHAAAVGEAAAALGIEHRAWRLDPRQKLALVQERQRAGAHVLMVGDGVNDGPVLAAADVSCAMGQGSAIAHAAADLLLINESLHALPLAIGTARRMRRVVRQNLLWAFVYNVTAVPLAALGWVPPWAAALGMSGSSLLVALNAARLARGRAAERLVAAPRAGDPAPAAAEGAVA